MSAEPENSLTDKILQGIEKLVIQTRPKPIPTSRTQISEVKYTDKRRPDNPTLEIPNFSNDPLTLRRISVIFKDIPDDNYQPRLYCTIDDVEFINTTDGGNPFISSDLVLEFKEGIFLGPSKSIKVYLWYKGADVSEKSATVLTTIGGL